MVTQAITPFPCFLRRDAAVREVADPLMIQLAQQVVYTIVVVTPT